MFLLAVGEEDEVSIRDIAYMVVEAMDFKGEVVVSCDLEIWLKIMAISRYHIVVTLKCIISLVAELYMTSSQMCFLSPLPIIRSL